MPVRDDLVSVYASSSARDIGGSAAFRALRDAHAGDPVFESERQIVEEAQRRLEVVVGGSAGGYAGQVRAAISELSRHRRHRNRDLYHALVVATYRNRPGAWSEAQKAHFDLAWTLIRNEYDFFLSFTSRVPENTAGHNPINDLHEHFIRRVLSDDVYDTADKKGRNLFAEAIFALLSEPPRKGFFFPHFQGDNQDVTAKLATACASSAAFVQVLQNILFVVPAPARPGEERANYCHWEYQKALEAFGGGPEARQRIFFVGAEGRRERLIAPHRVPVDYDDWYQNASGNDIPYLDTPTVYDAQRIEALRQTVLDKVLTGVDMVFDRLLDTIPS